MSQDKPNPQLQVATTQVVAGATGRLESTKRKGAVIMMTTGSDMEGTAEHTQRILRDRGLPNRETFVSVIANTVGAFSRSMLAFHGIPAVHLLVPDMGPAQSTFSGDGRDELLPGEDEGSLAQVVKHPSTKYRLTKSLYAPIVAVRGLIMAVDAPEGSDDETVDVGVQFYPPLPEIEDLFRDHGRGAVGRHNRGEDYDLQTVSRARLVSTVSRLVNLIPKGKVRVGSTFEMYFSMAYVDGRCIVSVTDIQFYAVSERRKGADVFSSSLRLPKEGEQVLNLLPKTEASETSAPEPAQDFFGRFLSRFKREVPSVVEPDKASTSVSVTTPDVEAVQDEPLELDDDPWYVYPNNDELLSPAECFLNGGFYPSLRDMWDRVVAHRPEVLTQLIAQPIKERPRPKARLTAEQIGPVTGGRRLLFTYNGPSLFSDIPGFETPQTHDHEHPVIHDDANPVFDRPSSPKGEE